MSDNDNKITVYGAEWCGFCHMVKQYLDGKNIKYTYIDVDKDPAKGMEAVEKSGQRGIPVTDFDGQIVIGFDRPRIDAALKDKALA
jgi:glutaredoxin-like YruB-family protein